MTCTSYLEFKKFLNRVPPSNLKNTVFLPIHQDRKFPDVPIGTKIKIGEVINPAVKIDVRTCIQRLKQGKNVAIYAFPNGLAFLDVDVENGRIKASTEFLQQIPPTFTVKTRNGGLQYYFQNPGNLKTQDIVENEINIGEFRANWSYVVSVGSYVPPDDHNNSGDGTYRVINDIPIAEMPTEFLSKLKTMVGTKEKDSLNLPHRLRKKTMTKETWEEIKRNKGLIYKRQL